MILEADHISFRYDNGNRQVLNQVSLKLESGERVGLSDNFDINSLRFG